MDGYSNSLDSYLAGKPVNTEASTEPRNSIDKYLTNDPNEHVGGIIEQAQRDNHDWERLSWGLKQVGANPDDYKYLQHSADLNAAKAKLKGTGIGTGTAFRRDYMPFSSLTSANFLAGPEGRVVGNSEYADAAARFKEGKASSDDIQAIATYEHHQEVDKDVKANARVSGLWGDRTGDGFANRFGGKLLLELGGLGKIGGEALVGAQALRPLAALRGGAGAAAAAGTAPAVPLAAEAAATASSGRAALGYAASKLPATLTTPSLYVPLAQQNNVANDRKPNDWRGYPTAFGYGYANMLVLGQLQKGTTGPLAVDAFRKGVMATAEIQGVDAAAGAVDQFLPKAYQIKPQDKGLEKFGSLGQWLAGPRGGGAAQSEKFLEDTTIQALSFSAFAAMHGKETKANDLAQSYADTFAKLRERGMGKSQAAEKIGELHDKLERELSGDPFLTKEKAAEALANHADADTKDYAAKLADVFEPQARVPAAPEAPQAPEPTPPAPETPAPEAPATTPEAAKPPEAPAAPPPEAPAAPATPTATPAARPEPTVEAAKDIFSRAGKSSIALLQRELGIGYKRAKALYEEALVPDATGPRPEVAAAATPEPATRQPVETAATTPEAPQSPATAPAPSEPVQPARPEIVPQAKAGAAPEPSVAPKPRSKVADALHEVFGNRLEDHSAAMEQEAYAVGYGDRFLAVTPGEGGRVDVNFASNEGQVGELYTHQKGVKEGTVTLLRDLQKLAGALGRRGIGIEYAAESKRHALYSRVLEGAGFTLVKSEKKSGARLGNYAWDAPSAEAKPASKTPSEEVKTPPAESASTKVEPPSEAPRAAAPSEAQAKEDQVRKRQQYKGLTDEEAAGTRAYDKLRNGFQDRVLAEARKAEPELADALETVSWNMHEERVVGSKGWKSGAGGRSVEDYAATHLIRDAKETIEDTATRLRERGKSELADRLTALAQKLISPEPAAAAAPKAGAAAPKAGFADQLPEADRQTLREEIVANTSYARTLDEFREAAARFVQHIEFQKRAYAVSSKSDPDGAQRSRNLDAFDVRIGAAREIANRMTAKYTLAKKPAAASPPAAKAAKAGAAKPRQPVNVEEPSASDIRDQWRSMDATDRRDVSTDPLRRKVYEDAGIDVVSGVRDAVRQERNQAGKAAGVGAVGTGERAGEDFKRLVEASGLSVAESQAARGVAAGWTLSKIASQTGKSKQVVQQAGVRAVKKIAARALEKLTADAAGDATRSEEVRALAEKIDGLSAESKPGTLESVIRALSGADAAARVEAREARGTVEIDSEGRVKHGEGDPDALYGGFPFRVALLEGLFGKAGAGQRTIWQRLSGFIFGDLPSAAAAAKQQEMDARIAQYAFDVKNSERDLKAAIRRATRADFSELTQPEIKRLDDLLRVDPHRIAAEALRLGVHPEVAAVIKSMREQVDALSQSLIDVGAVDGPLVATVQGNVGAYLNRQYQVFTDRAWESKVDPAVVNRFKSWLVGELAKEGEAWTPDRIDAEVKKLLRDGTAAENPIAYLRNTVLGSKDLSILKARTELPPELRALWGEYEDPLVNYTNSVGKMAHLLSSHLFLTRVAGEGLGTFLHREPTQNETGEYVHKFDTDNFAAFSPLEGLYTTKEIKAAFENAFSDRVTSAAMKHYMKVVAFSKFSKTALSLPGQARNFLSNVGIVVRNGLWQTGHLPGVFAEVFSDSPAAREYWRKLIGLGVVGEGIHYQDFKRTVEDAIGDREPLKDKNGLVAVDTILTRLLKGTLATAGRMYQYGDSFWKVYAFEAEAGRYEKAGFSRAEAEAKAAGIVRDTMPTYSKVPESLQKLRRFPFVAPFISFQAEMVRTTKNTVKQIWQDFADPRTRGIAATRLAGLTAAAILPAALTATFRAIHGVDDDEEKAVRRFLPEWQKESQLVFTGRQDNGQLKYLDLSKTDPHSYLSDGLLALFRAKDAKTGLKNAGDEWSKPFTQEELMVRPALDVARNRKEPGGQVYNAQDSTRQQALDVGRHLLRPFEPGGLPAARRAYMAWTGEPEQKSGKTYEKGPATLENFTGQREEPVRVKEELENKAHSFKANLKEADRMVQEMVGAKGMVSPEELKAARDRTEDGRKRAMEEFRDDVLAAERLGVSRKEIARVLHDAGLSAIEIGQLFTGTQLPYLPALRGTETERVRAGSVRKLAAPSQSP